jgi:hypothetical protein
MIKIQHEEQLFYSEPFAVLATRSMINANQSFGGIQFSYPQAELKLW